MLKPKGLLEQMKRFRIPLFFLCMTGFCMAQNGAIPAPPTSDLGGPWVEIDAPDVDMAALTPRGKQVLDLDGITWRHAQTPHFVIHYEQAIFARKVARMAEFMHQYIADDLQGVSDHADGRSHIFIFRSPKRWEEFRAVLPDVPAWSFSRVENTVLFLQQADDAQSSGAILAHEMTHIIINRFFPGDCPLWLNEGLATYYEEFGYAAFKGVKKSRRAQFSKLKEIYPLAGLFARTDYPSQDWQILSFYQTSKYLVGFLLLTQKPILFPSFMEDLIAGREVMDAFSSRYGIETLSDLEKHFRQFAQ